MLYWAHSKSIPALDKHTSPAPTGVIIQPLQTEAAHVCIGLCVIVWPWAWITVSQTIDSSSPSLHLPPASHFLLAWIIWCCNCRSISSAQSGQPLREVCRHSFLGPPTGSYLFMRWYSIRVRVKRAQIWNKMPSVNFLDRRKQLHGYHQMLVVSFKEWWLSWWSFATLNQQNK